MVRFAQRAAIQPFYASGQCQLTAVIRQADPQKLVTKTCYAQYMEFLALCEEAGVEAFVDAADEEEHRWQKKCEIAQEAHEEAKRQWSESATLSVFESADCSGAEHPELAQSSSFDSSQEVPDGDAPLPPGAAAQPVFVRPRYSWTPKMRDIFQKLLDNLQEMVNISIRCSE